MFCIRILKKLQYILLAAVFDEKFWLLCLFTNIIHIRRFTQEVWPILSCHIKETKSLTITILEKQLAQNFLKKSRTNQEPHALKRFFI